MASNIVEAFKDAKAVITDLVMAPVDYVRGVYSNARERGSNRASAAIESVLPFAMIPAPFTAILASMPNMPTLASVGFGVGTSMACAAFFGADPACKRPVTMRRTVARNQKIPVV